ncbi:MAG TPA: DinB family protein [Vicinamibacterales bacterium]|nr:DinB family protein [Vicinamibacterales bacterium]
MTIAAPHTTEFNEYYARYTGKVPASGPLAALHAQLATFEKLGQLSDSDASYRYADGKWSVKEVVGHISDVERLFSFRLLHIARGDQAALPGMDEKVWSAAAPHDRRRISELAKELIAVRHATIALVESLDEAAVARAGVASGFPVSTRALCWILPGHAQHHLDVLRERYHPTL